MVSQYGRGYAERGNRFQGCWNSKQMGTVIFFGVSGILDCIPASIFNEVHCPLELEAATKARNELIRCAPRPTSAGRCGSLVQSLKMRLNLHKGALSKCTGNDPANSAFDLVTSLNSGVWLVRLLENTKHLVDHCILVDARRSFVIDSAEKFPFILCPESLL